jgi:hypothetical protein
MSAVNSNAFTSGIPVLSGALPEFGSAANGSFVPQAAGSRDSIGPIAQPLTLPPQDGATSAWSGGWGNAGSGSDSGLAGFNAVMNGFVNALQNVLSSLGQQFGLTSSTSPSATRAQTFYSNATANSTGDPHDAFDGKPASGSNVNQAWDSMDSHADLLNSDSFNGAYQVSTTVTSPNEKGVTMNAQAQVALDGGATDITMNEDGSYSVSSNGLNVALEQGQAESLGNGESVTLNADSSLTVSARNGSGGSLVTTLSTKDGGVDVKNTAANVDLGGYLVTRTDDAGPTAQTPGYNGPGRPAPISYAYDPATDPNIEDQPIVMA